MRFWLEWMLAVHRAVWFPFHWATGLERPSVKLPVEYSPALAAAVRVGSTIEGRGRPLTKKAKLH